MKLNVVEIGKALPDYEDLLALSSEIRQVMVKKLLLEQQIKEGEAVAVKRATTEEQFFLNGKPPSMEYIKSTFLWSGINGELISVRKELAEVSAQLDQLKAKFEIIKLMFDVWRTLSANERSNSL